MLIKWKTKFTIILVLVIGSSLSGMGSYLLYRDDVSKHKFEVEKEFIDFRSRVDLRAATFDRDLDVNFEALRSLAILFNDGDKPDRHTFNQLAESIMARHSHVHAFSWEPRIGYADRAALEKQAREVFPGFDITQRNGDKLITASKRPEYFPVYYISPYLGNEAALGFDLASDAIRLDALEKARDSGGLQATASITLVQERGEHKGFLVFLPVYQGSQATVELRRKNLIGFISCVYRLADIFSHSAWSTDSRFEIDFKIMEKISVDKKAVIYPSSDEGKLFNNAFFTEKKSLKKSYLYEKELPSVLGQTWTLMASSPKKQLSYKDFFGPIAFFAVGMLFSIFMSMYLLQISKDAKGLRALNKRLDAISYLDGLTQIENRRRFDEYIAQELLRAIRTQSAMSVLMIDVDYFKSYNDHYGHVEGDRVLRDIATALKTVINRPVDLLARYGGEEFVIVLPDTEEAELIAARCNQVVRDLKIPHAYSAAASIITVSIGFETFIPDQGAQVSLVTENADKALYRAKEKGRDCAEKFDAQKPVAMAQQV
jgi:diguanylate cyclase (GGDEF)-like protein